MGETILSILFLALSLISLDSIHFVPESPISSFVKVEHITASLFSYLSLGCKVEPIVFVVVINAMNEGCTIF